MHVACDGHMHAGCDGHMYPDCDGHMHAGCDGHMHVGSKGHIRTGCDDKVVKIISVILHDLHRLLQAKKQWFPLVTKSQLLQIALFFMTFIYNPKKCVIL